MSTITVFNEQSELALAAYAHLYSGISQSNFINALKDTGMSDSQSNDFANNWSVIDSVELSEGASATIFEKIGKPGVRYLAICEIASN